MTTALYDSARTRLDKHLPPEQIAFALDDSFLESDGDEHLEWLRDAPIAEIRSWASHAMDAAGIVTLPTRTEERTHDTWGGAKGGGEMMFQEVLKKFGAVEYCLGRGIARGQMGLENTTPTDADIATARAAVLALYDARTALAKEAGEALVKMEDALRDMYEGEIGSRYSCTINSIVDGTGASIALAHLCEAGVLSNKEKDS